MAPAAHPQVPPTRSVTLADGRSLAYVELGAPDGSVVISNHGGLSSRLDVLPCAAVAASLGLRVVSPDRPGIGASDRREDRTMAGWASDVAELADRLGIERFATMGWSFGGGYAQAVAFHLADRVDALALVASGIPADWAGMREQINRMDRHFLAMSDHALGRAAERSVFHLMGAAARHSPVVFTSRTGLEGSDAQALVAAIAEGLHDTEGVVGDYQLMDRPWGFDPSAIAVPTSIWQGDADDLVPEGWARRLHDAIAGSTLTIVSGATHYLWYEHWDAILAGLVPDEPGRG